MKQENRNILSCAEVVYITMRALMFSLISDVISPVDAAEGSADTLNVHQLLFPVSAPACNNNLGPEILGDFLIFYFYLRIIELTPVFTPRSHFSV